MEPNYLNTGTIFNGTFSRKKFVRLLLKTIKVRENILIFLKTSLEKLRVFKLEVSRHKMGTPDFQWWASLQDVVTALKASRYFVPLKR
jgi:hypothetical protein